jgi:DNA polymerase-3 subunit alpha
VKNGERGQVHGAIRYSLAALKNIGAGAVEEIVKDRQKNGLYKSLGDFASRLDPKVLNKRGLETLAMAGAFDRLEANRALVHGNVDQIMALAQRQKANAEAGTSDLFGGGDSGPPKLDLRASKGWTPMERLQEEFDAVGFFLSGHPLDEYQSALAKMGVMRFTAFEHATERGATSARLGAIVISARERKSAKGNKFAFAMFSDPSGQFEAIIFSDTLATAGDLLEAGKAVLVGVEAERDGDTLKMRVSTLESLDKAVANMQRGLKITLDARALQSKPAQLTEIKKALKPGKGEVRLLLPLMERGREMEIVVPGRYDVSPIEAGLISAMPGVLEVAEV